jgi:hypothetical protein
MHLGEYFSMSLQAGILGNECKHTEQDEEGREKRICED